MVSQAFTTELLLDGQTQIIVLLAVLWTLPWKGWAMWKAAKNGHKWWFVVILVVNTLAVLDILYIFFFSEKKGAIGSQQA
ncbi:hypothetical protein C4571_02265 [Candidatus Parcubacteria bacterium]|nr:MAG: hypothetical protein C4571_02265 [Candidatus Parcubacteria bacterium]